MGTRDLMSILWRIRDIIKRDWLPTWLTTKPHSSGLLVNLLKVKTSKQVTTVEAALHLTLLQSESRQWLQAAKAQYLHFKKQRQLMVETPLRNEYQYSY